MIVPAVSPWQKTYVPAAKVAVPAAKGFGKMSGCPPGFVNELPVGCDAPPHRAASGCNELLYGSTIGVKYVFGVGVHPGFPVQVPPFRIEIGPLVTCVLPWTSIAWQLPELVALILI